MQKIPTSSVACSAPSPRHPPSVAPVSVIVVAAASLLARTAFLDGLAECGEACASDLHPGAGTPAAQAARRVYRIGGMELLGKAAKLHFKNTTRVEGRR